MVKTSLILIFQDSLRTFWQPLIYYAIKTYIGNPNVPAAGNLKPRDSNPMLSIVISDPSSGHSKSATMKKVNILKICNVFLYFNILK